jgi:AbiJ N-terminal domain 3/Abortive infection C-terminus
LTAPLENFDFYLATTAQLLEADGLHDCVETLAQAEPRVEATGYDNWDGGTYIFTVYLGMPPVSYARIGARRESIEEQINQRLKATLEAHTSNWYSVKIVPKIAEAVPPFEENDGISRQLRQNIFDGMKLEGVVWSGALNEVEFLGRLYDLDGIKSNDSRYKTASGDIWQHRVNNPEDWPDDWVYNDPRFNLIGGPKELFLKFLCELAHPVVRPNRDEAIKLVHDFNEQLQHAGWHLSEEERIAGRPRFVPRPVGKSVGRNVSRARSVADALNAGWMHKQIERLENSVQRDPSLAIGTAKELVETCCKTILSKLGVPYDDKTDLPALTKKLAKELRLVPEGVSNEAKGAETARLILQNFAVITQHLAELRNLYGSGHGRTGSYRGLEARHARLAVGAAVVFIDFVTETYHRRTGEAAKGGGTT